SHCPGDINLAVLQDVEEYTRLSALRVSECLAGFIPGEKEIYHLVGGASFGFEKPLSTLFVARNQDPSIFGSGDSVLIGTPRILRLAQTTIGPCFAQAQRIEFVGLSQLSSHFRTAIDCFERFGVFGLSRVCIRDLNVHTEK